MRLHIKKIWTVFLFFLVLLPVFPAGAQDAGIPTNDRIVQGQVMEVNGGPIPNASVSIYDRTGALAVALSGQNPDVTNANGEYLFHVNPGMYRLNVTKTGYIPSLLNTLDAAKDYFYTTNTKTVLDLPMRLLTPEQQKLMTEGETLYQKSDGQITDQCVLAPIITETTNYFDFYSSLNPLLSFQVQEQTAKINPDCIQLKIDGLLVHPFITPITAGYDVKYAFDSPIDSQKNVQLTACDITPEAKQAIKNLMLLSPVEQLLQRTALNGTMTEKIRTFLATINPVLTVSGNAHPFYTAKPAPLSLTQFPMKLPIPTPVAYAGIAFLVFSLGTYLFLRPWLFPVAHPKGDLFIVYDTVPNVIDPFVLDEQQRRITANVFESLIDLDPFFRPQAVLAKTWGNISPTEWELKLRQGVKFQDGSILTVDDVLYSWERAKTTKTADMALLTDTIEKIEKTTDDTIHIFTVHPDPLFLTKLRFLPIVKEVKQEQQTELIGTGPYTVKKQDMTSFAFESFKDYWGDKGIHPVVHVHALADKYDRLDELLKGNIDILGSFPVSKENSDRVTKEQKFDILKVSGFETIYMMFRPKVASIFVDQKVREALSHVIHPENFTGLDDTGLRPTHQFVASGIPGATPETSDATVQDTTSFATFLGENNISFTLTTTKDFQILADFVRVNLEPLGVHMKIEILDVDAMHSKMQKGEIGAFIAGWRFDLGDSLAFFQNYAEGSIEDTLDGKTTVISVVDLVQQASQEIDVEKRTKIIEKLHTYMLQAYQGIPLFETQKIFVKKKAILWKPRLDGEIRFNEIH